MDDRSAGAGAEWKRSWREFLRLSNVLQHLPEVAWMTSTGLAEGIYGSLLEAGAPEKVRHGNAEIELLLADVLHKEARQIVLAADAASIVLPEPGFEIANSDGEIVAVAELAWPDQKVCVLTEEQKEYANAARITGWTVWMLNQLVTHPHGVFIGLPKRNA
jgi:DEAD/DEAH box helicase domain-containing protein